MTKPVRKDIGDITLNDLKNELIPSLGRTLVPIITAFVYSKLGTEFIDEGTLVQIIGFAVAFLQYGAVRVVETVTEGPTKASLLIGGKTPPKYVPEVSTPSPKLPIVVTGDVGGIEPVNVPQETPRTHRGAFSEAVDG